MQHSHLEPHLDMKPTTGRENVRAALSVLGVIAIIIVAGILVAEAFRFLPTLSEKVANVGAAIFFKNEEIAVSTDRSTVELGEVFELSFAHRNPSEQDAEGTYSLRYPCGDADFERLGTDAGATPLECGTWYPIASAGPGSRSGAIRLRAIGSDARFGSAAMEIEHMPAASSTNLVRGEALIIVVNQDAPAAADGTAIGILSEESRSDAISLVPAPEEPADVPVVPPPAPTKPALTAGTASTSSYRVEEEETAGPVTTRTYTIDERASSTPASPPDLSVRIIEIGKLDRLTGAFLATTTLRAQDRIAVKFEVKNIGGRVAPDWYFNAVLPTFPSHIFTSEGQAALNPGDRVEFVIGFDNVISYKPREVVINADPANAIGEADEKNNVARVPIELL